MPRHLAATYTLVITLLCGIPVSAPADTVVELPVLAAIRQNNLGVFEILMMWWDKKPEPNPVQLQWLLAGVRLGNAHLGAMAQAFAYAVERTPSVQHSGTVSVQGVAYQPTRQRRTKRRRSYGRGIHRHVQGGAHSAGHCPDRNH